MPSATASAADAVPLTLAELAATLAAIGAFEERPQIAVAVSGGPDSMALLLLAHRWATARGGGATGLIVDHGLRPESAAEARTVAGWLAARGIAHAVLTWEGAKPAHGIQAAARAARYALLADWCRRHGVLHLLVAHQREDQAETYLLRRRAGSGGDGLAAMSAVRELPGCRVVRPLLAVPRARLTALLAAASQPFLCDPSNRNPAFERARLRRSTTEAAVDAAWAVARACGGERIAREAALDRLIGRAVALHPAGFAAIDQALLAAADDDLAARLLGRVSAAIGGARYPARRARLARLRAALVALPERGRTLGGCRLVPWRGRILVLRELAAAASPLCLPPGVQRIWDSRFVVTTQNCINCVTIGYLGQSGAGRPRCAGGGAVPRLAHAVFPAFWDAAGIVAVPHLGYRRAAAERLPALVFAPANGATQASFTVV